ncbi:TPA: elongation factor P [Candidatus Saccharibacteria bacterium]|nr:elongation factor P [Candidatus Saccharibacteria bacterium]HIO87734.1 elongation factor P [Candidatus Saccharibacteria bacterium]
MLSITDLKKGTLITIDNQPFKVVEYAQKQMGRGGSIVNTKLKNLISGATVNKTFHGNDKIESADVSSQKVQFLYADTALHFMDGETYEQFEIDPDLIGDQAQLLKEGMDVTAQLFEGNVINVELPTKIKLEVVEAPEVVKGDTQSTVQKKVKLETGAEIMAPIFVKTGDVLVVDSRDSSYVERAK